MTLDNDDPFSDDSPEDDREKDNNRNSMPSFEEIRDTFEKDKKVVSELFSGIDHYAVETKIRNNRVYSCVKKNGNELDDFDSQFPSEEKKLTDSESAAKQHLKHCARVKKYIDEKEAKIKKNKQLKQVTVGSIGVVLVGVMLFYSFPYLRSWTEKPIDPVNPYENMIKVDNFWIDKTEVSIEDYKKFVTDYKRPARFSSDELPVVGISWSDAKKFAKHQGKELCSDDEWLRALGNNTQELEKKAHLRDNLMNVPREVSNDTEKNEKGILNMLGNAKEWVSDSSGNGAFAIGGYWYWRGNSSNDLRKKSEKTLESDRQPYIGFRCCSKDKFHD